MRALLAFQLSAASARIALIKSVDSRNPRACNVSNTGRTADNKPCRLARTRMPTVPVTANPQFFAAALAGKSSIKPGCNPGINYDLYLTAIGATVEPVPPLIFSGSTTKANSYALSFASASSSIFSNKNIPFTTNAIA